MDPVKRFASLKPDKALLQTLALIIFAFVISSLPVFLSFFLKNINPAEYGLIQGNAQDLEITYKEILFFASVVMALCLLSVSYRYIQHRIAKITVISFAVAYLSAALFIVLMDVIYYLIFAYRMNFSVIQTIINTNPEEVQGFIKLYNSAACIGTILAFIAFAAFIIFKRAWFVALFSTTSFFITSLVFSLFGIIDFGQVAHSKGNGPHNVRYWDIVIGEYNEYREFNRRLDAEKNNHNLSKEYNGFYKQDTLTKTIVLVVSESLSKRHMSFYGYQRATTPTLDKNKTIYKFNNCVTQAALTIEAVPALFFNGYLSRRINLIALLNKMDYETTWISNQSGWGKGDATIVLLSQLCKRSVFLDGTADDNKANVSLHYDDDVLAQFDKELATPCRSSRFIVLHFMGCHYDYERRYPANRNFFTSEPPVKIAVDKKPVQVMLNAYDNAMLYHDSIINQVLGIFSKHNRDKNAALVFLSDHGEELYENRDYAGHGYPPSKVTAEIPYFTVLSENFKKNYPGIETAMRTRGNTPYSTVNNFYTMIHLMNINSKKYQRKILNNGFFSPRYDSTATRYVMGSDYSKMTR